MIETLEPLFEVTEGWTGILGPFTIWMNGVKLDLTSLDVSLVLHRASGLAVSPGGSIVKLNQVTNVGELTYTPVADDFKTEENIYSIHQPHLLHWKIVDGVGKVAFAPHGAPAIVMVHRA